MADQLAQAAAETNAQPDQRLDPMTTYTHMVAKGRHVTYHYALDIDDRADLEALVAKVKPRIIPTWCGAQAQRELLDYGVTATMMYAAGDRRTDFTFGSRDCADAQS